MAEEMKTYQDENGQNASQEKQAIIVEIRAGTGGDEASLFARDLFRMYSRFGQIQGWNQKTLNSSLNSLGGYKEIVFELSGSDAYNLMKYEGGVHRVQRIPRTEKQGRVHTSTVTVAILHKPRKAEVNINPSELKITTFKASGPGGQYVNKTESAVRVLHVPTGIVVTSQSERNQLKNKENALSILEAKLLEKKQQEQESQITGTRREQIGWAKRAEKMRTYNFPQDRITDHRIGKSWHDIESVMNGKMDRIVKAFRKYEQGQ